MKPTSSKLSQLLRASLVNYLKNPDNSKNQKKLVDSAFQIYQDVANISAEPDNYMIRIDELVRPAVQDIAIHPYTGKKLDAFNRELSLNENPAFHVLTLIYNLYLKKNVINPREIVNHKLEIIDRLIQQLKAQNNPFVKKLEKTHAELHNVIDNYFKLPEAIQIKRYASFSKKLQRICAKHKKSIEKNTLIKTVIYELLATISLLFIKPTLSERFYQTGYFFCKASVRPKKALSDFVLPRLS